MEDDPLASPLVQNAVGRTEVDSERGLKSADDEEIQDSIGPFSASYVPEMPHANLEMLPEDTLVQDFHQPSIEVTDEDIDPLFQPSGLVSKSSLSPTHGTTNGLSPIMPNSPGRRRRSSVTGHRRKSSVRSLAGLGIAASPELRHRNSISSNPGDFEDFQDGDAGSDFGDFDDFEEGDFQDDLEEDQTGTPLEKNGASTRIDVPREFPNLQDENSVRLYVRSTVSQLLAIETNPDKFEALEDGDDAQDTGLADSDEEDESPFMLTDRAVSLWKQLTAPPPLQPPDWKRSRIRRLFLVSLGIPVDLDEILPKMTHKKLVLPSTRRHRDKKTADERRSRKKIPPPPDFEITMARQLCATTREAISAMSERDLEIHVTTLRAHTAAASGLLTYWLEQREAAQSEKDTFEQVVSNLVQYHKKQKDEQKEKTTNAAKKSRSRFSMRG
ncbi:Putative uncharacterized protein [Taphrina deformans PYCC 5710]|uniref:Uncharacterized protein n=1 Tax=Taphrina deformans (strain PYCC 5710 / ATCC 11124 / CBS 356.35 / IMI 108563 / JCM 9778 / NBRC 8474) TaxID=1097556 RepID=R4X9L2_TAPDE|nr:Putative uncharacterized protein [Taphrina deformans PYCC 5710]|eukprot:CCG82415.1 Putative uncharacterized protein [Taphrina deformans PYCC 5710]